MRFQDGLEKDISSNQLTIVVVSSEVDAVYHVSLNC